MVRVTKPELHRTISDIMKKGNLDELTTKKIRILCEQKYKVDLTRRRKEIDRIVMAFVDKQTGNRQNVTKDDKVESSSGGESDSGESEEESSRSSGSSGSESCSDSECSDSSGAAEQKKPMNKVQVAPKAVPVPKKAPVKKANVAAPAKKVSAQPAKKPVTAAKPPAKRVKKDNSAKQAELDDAAYARKLQAEEWNFRQRTVKKLFRDNPHKKSVNTEQTKKKKASPFMKKCLLSPALAEVIGTNEMSRPDIVQKMWSVVRERNLFDASNKQYAFCDDQLREIFGKKRIRLIGMMKYLKKHIRDIH